MSIDFSGFILQLFVNPMLVVTAALTLGIILVKPVATPQSKA